MANMAAGFVRPASPVEKPQRTHSVSSQDSLTGMPPPPLIQWAVPQKAKLKFTLLFNSYDRTRTGFLTGAQAKNILDSTGLSQPVLAKIWSLSDIDMDGRLSCEEFVLAMHLAESVKTGDALPVVLPADLIPPSHRRSINIQSCTASPRRKMSDLEGSFGIKDFELSLSFLEQEDKITKAFECARNGDPRAEEVLVEVYQEFKEFCCEKAGLPKNDLTYHRLILVKDLWQEKVMKLRCDNNRRELRNLKSQLTDTVATVDRLSQQLEESKDNNKEVKERLQNLERTNRELAEKQEHLTEDNARLKQQLEESNASNAEQLRSKHEVLSTAIRDLVEKEDRLTEDNARMRQLEESKDNNKEIGERLQDLERTNEELAAKQERLIEDNARMRQQLEESNAKNREMGSKLDLLLTVVKDLAEKQTEDTERMNQQLEESNAKSSRRQFEESKNNNKEIGERLQDLERTNEELAAKQDRLIEENERIKQQLQESNAKNSRTTKKLEDLASMNKELAAKQERLIEDNERMKQQLQETNANSSRTSKKPENLVTEEDDTRRKQQLEESESSYGESSDVDEIARDQELAIARDQELAIARDQELAIARDQELAIARDQELAIARGKRI